MSEILPPRGTGCQPVFSQKAHGLAARATVKVPVLRPDDIRLREAELRRLARVKHTPAPMQQLLGPEMVNFFKQSVQKRQTKFGKIADVWSKLVPELLLEHCALDSFSRGTLTVLVDSASHLYELKQLLLAGLQQQILLSCGNTGLQKISLKRGRWYDDGNGEGEQKLRFDR